MSDTDTWISDIRLKDGTIRNDVVILPENARKDIERTGVTILTGNGPFPNVQLIITPTWLVLPNPQAAAAAPNAQAAAKISEYLKWHKAGRNLAYVLEDVRKDMRKDVRKKQVKPAAPPARYRWRHENDY